MITYELPNIPVTLDERVYDLHTLTQLKIKIDEDSGNPFREDPYTRLPFRLVEIQPARSIKQEIENKIQKSIANKQKEAIHVEENSNRPSI